MRPYLYTLLILSSILSACGDSQDAATHKKWQQERLAELTEPFGWTSVVGIYYLKNSIAYFGRTEQNDFVLPESAPTSIGYLEKTEDGVVMRNFQNLGVEVDGVQDHNVLLRDDHSPEGPSLCTWGSLQWYVLNRQGEYYLRVKDTLSPYRTAFDEIPTYSYDPSYAVTATLIPAAMTDSVRYLNELNQSFVVPAIGKLKFSLHGKEYNLDLLENDDNSYYVIVGDLTNGDETYGGGRYIYPKKVDASGVTFLDFNYLINPPCVFTPYATCPLPPENNRLEISIPVGEKYLKVY